MSLCEKNAFKNKFYDILFICFIFIDCKPKQQQIVHEYTVFALQPFIF